MRTFLSVVVTIALLVSGQLLWKYGLNRIGDFTISSRSLLPGLLKLATSPYIIVGMILYVLSTVVYFDALSKEKMSFVWPLLSFSYVVGLFAAQYLFHESISAVRWTGVVIVCLGVALITRG